MTYSRRALTGGLMTVAVALGAISQSFVVIGTLLLLTVLGGVTVSRVRAQWAMVHLRASVAAQGRMVDDQVSNNVHLLNDLARAATDIGTLRRRYETQNEQAVTQNRLLKGRMRSLRVLLEDAAALDSDIALRYRIWRMSGDDPMDPEATGEHPSTQSEWLDYSDTDNDDLPGDAPESLAETGVWGQDEPYPDQTGETLTATPTQPLPSVTAILGDLDMVGALPNPETEDTTATVVLGAT